MVLVKKERKKERKKKEKKRKKKKERKKETFNFRSFKTPPKDSEQEKFEINLMRMAMSVKFERNAKKYKTMKNKNR